MPAPLSRATAGRNDYIGAEADDVAALPPGDQAARQSAAKRLREKYPRWVVVWVARTARYHAYPLASSRAGGAGLTANPVRADVVIAGSLPTSG